MTILGDTKQWFKDNGDNTHRVNYDLNKRSVVFDIGGYIGDFTHKINKIYGCTIHCFEPVDEYFNKLSKRFETFNNIKLFNEAVCGYKKRHTLFLNGDKSSSYIKSNNSLFITSVPFNEVAMDRMDLVKINIEGGEYDLLDYMIKEDLVSRCSNIQVQFHKIGDYEENYKNTASELTKTHSLTYRYPFVWENWKLK